MSDTEARAQRIGAHQLAAWRAFLFAHAAVIERIERDLAAAGQVSLGAYDVLIALAEAPEERLRMRELAGAVALNRSTLSRRIDRLESAGMLVRERVDSDKRGAYAALTERGREALRRAWPVYAHGIQDYFLSRFSDEEIGVVRDALSRVNDAARRDES